MKTYLDQKEIEVIELTSNEMMLTEGGSIPMDKLVVIGAFMFGFGPGLLALGYYNGSH
ncbi:hypothetical protein [Flavobacterium reichenbachii]|uniref:hypothetical protein n=1 Tax=Flavobacterium reichenbachii TaxID=362418 RepID=UPI000ACF177E|nr:hypothetical protein [Flavobacterium reichenbachii]